MIDIAKAIRSDYVDIVRDVLETAYSDNKLMLNSISRVSILTRVGECMYQYYSQSRAWELFREAEALTSSFQDGMERARAECLIGASLAIVGEAEQARLIFLRAENTASEVKLSNLQRTALSFVSLTYAKVGFIADAERLLQNRDVLSVRNGREAEVIVLASQGKIDEAIQRSRDIRDIKVRARALRYVAEIEIKNGRPKRAVQIAKLIISNRETESDPVAVSRIMKAIAQAGEVDSFKQLFIHNAYRTGSAYMMLGLLARLYPMHVTEIEEVLVNNLQPHLSGVL